MSDDGYSRWRIDAEGARSKRYTAVDPADAAVRCNCGREGCPRGRLLSFREHMAELYRVLRDMHGEEISFTDPSEWASILYGLRMAASIRDVEADTGYVEDPMVFALCEPSGEYEDAQSEMASKYVAGATIFNFLWLAYESAVSVTAPDELRRLTKEERFGERGRRLFEARPEVGQRFRGLTDVVKVALLQCGRGGRMEERLDRIEAKYRGPAFVTAAELCREFRNFLFHGEDEVPSHEDWGDAVISRCRIYRFYSVSRLLLYLIQGLSWITEQGSDELMEYGSDDDELTHRQVLERLQFRGPGIWPPL